MEDLKAGPGEPVPQDDENNERHKWISVAAYYKSEKRGFIPGFEEVDWLAAEKDYFEMLIAAYLDIVEEDGAMTIVSLQKLAKEIGVLNPKHLNTKVALIRAIQESTRTHGCFRFDPSDLCNEVDDCQWKKECRKLIAIWKRRY